MLWRGVAGEGQVGEHGWEYWRRRPEGTVLYEAVRDNLATLLVLLGHIREGDAGGAPRLIALLHRGQMSI